MPQNKEPLLLVPKSKPTAPPQATTPIEKRTTRIVQHATAVTSELTDASKGPLECPPGRVLKTVGGKRFCAKVKPRSEYAQPPWLRQYAFTSERQPAKRTRGGNDAPADVSQ